jgi:hypothetical protein
MSEIDKIDKIDKIDEKKDAAYKKRMCKGRDKTTLEKLEIIKNSLISEDKLPRSLKILITIIEDMNKKKENQNLKRKKYDGL